MKKDFSPNEMSLGWPVRLMRPAITPESYIFFACNACCDHQCPSRWARTIFFFFLPIWFYYHSPPFCQAGTSSCLLLFYESKLVVWVFLFLCGSVLCSGFVCFVLRRFGLHRPYSISIRVIPELFIICQGKPRVYQCVRADRDQNAIRSSWIGLEFLELTKN